MQNQNILTNLHLLMTLANLIFLLIKQRLNKLKFQEVSRRNEFQVSRHIFENTRECTFFLELM